MEGQSLLEFSVSLLVIVPVLLAAAALIRSEWARARCAYQVFEVARARLNSQHSGFSLTRRANIAITLEDTPQELHARALCGNISEQIRFQKLDHAEF